MCGRYRLSKRDRRWLENEFGVDADDVTAQMVLDLDRENIKPTQEVLAVVGRDDERRRPERITWGVKLPKRQLINARDDKVMESRLWRPMFTSGRLLLPATGFYEWSGPKGARQPHLFESSTFALGGIARNTASGREAVIVTTEPNELVAPIHDRMPVMLAPDDFDDWLFGDVNDASALLRPWPHDLAESALPVGSI